MAVDKKGSPLADQKAGLAGIKGLIVLDGTWTRTRLFWWPAFGLARQPSPEVGRSPLVWLVLEAAGVALAVVAWRRYGLASSDNRRLLAAQGHLARGVLR